MRWLLVALLTWEHVAGTHLRAVKWILPRRGAFARRQLLLLLRFGQVSESIKSRWYFKSFFSTHKLQEAVSLYTLKKLKSNSIQTMFLFFYVNLPLKIRMDLELSANLIYSEDYRKKPSKKHVQMNFSQSQL